LLIEKENNTGKMNATEMKQIQGGTFKKIANLDTTKKDESFIFRSPENATDNDTITTTCVVRTPLQVCDARKRSC